MPPRPDDSEKRQRNSAGNRLDFNIHLWLHIETAHEPMSDCIQTTGYNQIQANLIGYIHNGSGSDLRSWEKSLKTFIRRQQLKKGFA